jgi:hypothetical protein
VEEHFVVVWYEMEGREKVLCRGTVLQRFNRGKYFVNCFLVRTDRGFFKSPPVAICRVDGFGEPPEPNARVEELA